MASGSKIDLHLAVREVALNLYDASGDSAWVEHPNGSFDIMTMQIDELFKDTDM
jgi:penicillin V acylase-like amidase (Ntn superfamily)